MNFASRAGSSVAIAAAVMSVTLAVFVPYGRPWASLAWAVLACAAAVWVRHGSVAPAPRMSEVIREIEAERQHAPGSNPETFTAKRSI